MVLICRKDMSLKINATLNGSNTVTVKNARVQATLVPYKAESCKTEW
jgi:hypothetical protein